MRIRAKDVLDLLAAGMSRKRLLKITLIWKVKMSGC